MRFTVNRPEMLDAVKTALKAVTTNKTIPAISGLLIEADAENGVISITGTDIRTQIQRRLKCDHISEGGSGIFNPLLGSMLKLLDGETVEFSADSLNNRYAEIHSGTCRYTVPYMPGEDFPKIHLPFPEDFIAVKGLNSLIRRTVFAAEDASPDIHRASLQFVKLTFADGNTRAEATDGNCIAVSDSPHCGGGNLELILHKKALQMLSGIVKPDEDLYVGVAGKFAMFIKSDLFFASMMHEGDYLEGSRLIKRIQPAYKATVDGKEFFDLVSNVSTIFSTGDDQCVTLHLADDHLLMQSVTVAGSSSARINATDIVPTPDTGFHYKPKYLLNCLSHAQGPLHITIDGNGAMLLEANQSHFVVCPRGQVHIRVKEDEKPKAKKARSTKAKKTETAVPAAA